MMTTRSGLGPYQAVPVRPGARDIRLVKVLPGSSSRMRCQFISCQLRNPPPYTALSYTWGSPEKTEAIELQSQTHMVGKNLFGFLCRVRRDANESLFWIDALCIDQDNTQERNDQVHLMRDIYSSATRVIVWLGDATPENCTAVHLIESAYRELSKTSPSAPGPGRGPRRGRAESGGVMTPAERDKVAALYEHEYWSRVWIVQEVMCARELVVYWGKRTVRWECLLRVCEADPPGAGARLRDSPAAVLLRDKAAWKGSPVPLARLVSTYWHLRSTDIRDKVFGLLGLASEQEGKDGEVGIIRANYDMAPVDVLEATCRVAFQSGALPRYHDKVQFGKGLRDSLGVPFPDRRLWELARQRDNNRLERRSMRRHQHLVHNSVRSYTTIIRVKDRPIKSTEQSERRVSSSGSSEKGSSRVDR